MLTRITKKYPSTINVEGKQRNVIFTEESKELIQGLIDNHTRAIAAYNNLHDWTVSTISIKYLQVNPVDAVGRIVSINYDTRDVEIELIDDCNDPNSYRYIDPKDYDLYNLKIRGLVSRTAGEPLTDNVMIKYVAFDLIKCDNKRGE